jgi:16S rRNA (guanine527-N7)-methyltransferase
MNYTIESFKRDTSVSRETVDDYKYWYETLCCWNDSINLVSRSTLGAFWERHAYDSWQLVPHIPEKASTFLDLGSGAGFPGLSVAISCKHRGHGSVLLVDSAGKKGAFLKKIIRDRALPAQVSTERVEKIDNQSFDVISARAFAPLPKLLSYTQRFWGKSTVGLFLKGETVEEELTAARKKWSFNVEKIQSRTNFTGCLLKITELIVQ